MDWKLFLKKTKKDYGILNKEIPGTFEGFSIMGKEAKKSGLVSEKTKEQFYASASAPPAATPPIARQIRSRLARQYWAYPWTVRYRRSRRQHPKTAI